MIATANDDKGSGVLTVSGSARGGADRDRASSSSCHVWVRRTLHSSILRKLYFREGRSIRAVAMALGVADSRLYRALKKAGITTSRPGRPTKKLK